MTSRLSSLPSFSLVLGLALGACGGPSTGTVTTPLDQTDGRSARTAIEAAISGNHRSEESRSRDAYRHPLETLMFFGLEPGMTVVEMGPGGGWYTEILAPVLQEEGRLIAAAPPGDTEYGVRFDTFLATNPELYGRIERLSFNPPDSVSLGPDGSADMVVTFRSTHGWINRGFAQAVYQAMFAVLKPGGVLGVEQHRGPEGISAESGYVPEATVIEIAQAAGFVLEARSEINANPADDHDHPEGVWSLPPTLRGATDENRAEYEAIGESDRMTLRFRKPAMP
ncbi:MAG: class I SAM-dependent methyltransferase [Sandaracinaceae bacterium]|nr:class I SAM-dependent methyltransferase [Sandaracinaceae bacterium]